jgi:hypothetical protein
MCVDELLLFHPPKADNAMKPGISLQVVIKLKKLSHNADIGSTGPTGFILPKIFLRINRSCLVMFLLYGVWCLWDFQQVRGEADVNW